MAIKFLSGQTIDGTLTVSGNVQGATFNGLAINTTGTNNLANQIVRTQANGYANFGWINSVSGNHTGAITRITASNDAYLRYVTPAQFRTGVTDGYYAPVSTVSGVTSVATTNGITGGTIISTGTIQVDSTVVRTTGDQSITGNKQFYPSSTGTGYSTAAIELMASSSGLTGTPPRIGFHWGGVVASNIAIESNGTIVIRDNPGTGYEDFKALNITATGVVYASGGNSGTWNSHTSNTGTVTSVATGNGLTGGTIISTGTLSMSGSYTGGFTATTSMTSPIYYDANDGGYYGDFASTSVFNKINTGIGNLGRSRMASYSMTAGNWYRIANGAGRACGDIYIQDGISGGPHGNLTFYAGSSYSQYAGTMLKLKSSSFYSLIGFTEIRLLIGTTYQEQYVEILCQRTGTYYITVQDTHANTNNWALSASATVGSVPTGYSDSTRLDINGMLIAEAGNGSNRFAVDRVGAIHLSGGTSGSSGQVLTSGGTGSPTWTTLQNQTGGPFLPLAGGTVTGLTNLIAGSKIVVQNGTNGGASRGIFMWTNTDANWGIYMATPGATQNMAGGAAPSGLNGESSHSIRFRIAGGATNGFIWENNNNATLMSMNGNSGNLTTGASMRSPIFYDSLNTAYYGDFASTSVMSRINVGNGNSPAIQCVANASYGAGTELEIGGWSTGTTVSRIRNSNGNLHIDSKSGHNMYLNHYPPGNILVGNGGGYLLAYQSMRAPIFYDSDNAAYYGNFASNSSMNTITFNGGILSGTLTMNTQKALVANNYGRGVYGLYNASRFQHLWSMGTAYNLADNGTSPGNLYGVSWSHPNAGGVAANLNNHGMLLLLNGGYQAAISGSIRCVTDMRTPIYYDSNNTAYYTNPASTSRLNTLNCDGAITSGTSSTGNIYCGNVGSTHMRLHVVGNTSYFDMNSGNISWRQGSSTRYIFYSTTANMTIYGTLTQGSDIRIKENIVEIGNCIDKVKSIRGVYYNRTDFNTEPTKIGVIAQEVEEQMPELIHNEPTTGIKSVSYTELTAVLVNAIKEQQVIIDDLKLRIEKLEL